MKLMTPGTPAYVCAPPPWRRMIQPPKFSLEEQVAHSHTRYVPTSSAAIDSHLCCTRFLQGCHSQAGWLAIPACIASMHATCTLHDAVFLFKLLTPHSHTPDSPTVSLKGCSSTRLSVLYFCAFALLAVLRLAPLGGGRG